MRISDWSSDVCSSDLDDVISGLIHNDFRESDSSTRKLGDDEIFGYCRLIMLAGGGTTWRQLGITIYALLSNYEYWQACRDDRTLIDSAIHESLRWCPTDPNFPRLATRDTEVAGVRSAESRVGNEGVRTCSCRGAPYL